MRKTLTIAAVLLLFAGGCIAVGGTYLVKRFIVGVHEIADPRIKEHESELRSHLPEFLKMQELIKDHPFFRIPSPGKADAGPFLNSKVAWGDSVPAQTNELKLPEALVSHLKTLGPDWLEKSADLRLDGISFEWMKELLKFDYWDYENDERAKMPPPYTMDSISGVNFPDMVTLRYWAYLRLMKAYSEKGNYVEAIEESYKIAQLAYSTETLVGAMVGISILRMLSTFTQAIKAVYPEGTLPRLVDANIFLPLRNAIYNYSLFLGIFSEAEIRDRVIANAPAGFCAGIHELAAREGSVRPFTKALRAREVEDIKKIIVGTTLCRLRNAKLYWSDVDLDQRVLESDKAIAFGSDSPGVPKSAIPFQKYWLKIPGVVPALAESLLSGAGYDWSKKPMTLPISPAVATPQPASSK